MRSKYYNLNVNSTTLPNEQQAKYSMPAPFTSYTRIMQDQRNQMLGQLKDPLTAGPGLMQNVKEQPEQIRGPNCVQIYQAPKKHTPPPPREAGFASHTFNNTVSKEVIDSLGGIRDTIKPIALSLSTHEMRPYDLHVDYKQTITDLRREDQESVRQSISCLRGFETPKPLYNHEGDAPNGVNMIGKARLVSASPFRATIKMDRRLDEPLNDDSDDEFARDELPVLNKSHQSPIKDDSVILRN